MLKTTILSLAIFISLSIQGQVHNSYHFTNSLDTLGRTQWVSYRLTKEMVEDTVRYRRAGFWGTPQFEYRNSGYDRGHMANHSAFDFDERVHETFNFINIVPQTRFINRTVIKYLEEYERKLTSKYGCLYFVIRAVYEEIGADVPMPTLPPGIPIYFIREVYTCDATLVTSFKIENIP